MHFSIRCIFFIATWIDVFVSYYQKCILIHAGRIKIHPRMTCNCEHMVIYAMKLEFSYTLKMINRREALAMAEYMGNSPRQARATLRWIARIITTLLAMVSVACRIIGATERQRIAELFFRAIGVCCAFCPLGSNLEQKSWLVMQI